MKKQSITMIALAMLLALSFMSATTAFAVTTTAAVSFIEGVVEFGDPELDDGMSNMDLDFGSQTLPVGPSDYLAEDGSGGQTGSHTLRVLNSRTDADEWYVTVAMGKFTSTDVTNSFAGTITMTGPTASAGLNAESSITIISEASAVDVVSATTGITNGTYDTTWSQSNIKLTVNEPDVSTITEPASYSATLTWALVDAPT